MALNPTPAPALTPAQAAIMRYRTDPVAWVREVLQAEPQAWQQEAFNALVAHDKITVRSGHGIGKSCWLSWAALWWLSTRYPAKVACTAPSAHQLEDVLWSEIRAWVRRMPKPLQEQFVIKSDKIELAKGGSESFIVARTARKENPEALQGFHSANLLFLLDEASGIDDEIFVVSEGALSTPGAKVIMTGNPTRTSGYFYDSHNKMRHRWHTMRVGSDTATTVSKTFVEDMAKRYGQDSNIYKVRVLGEFPSSEDDAVIPLHLCEAAVRRDVARVDGSRLVWGLDVARFGSDRSALCKRWGNHLVEPIKSWQGKDTMTLAGIILMEYREAEHKPDVIVVDVIGVGAGVLDRLVDLNLPAIGCNVAESAAVSERFLRLRDELWFGVRDWLARMDCKMADDDELISEMTNVKYKVTPSGKLKVESKDEMRSRGARSPDLADSLCLVAGTKVLTPEGLRPIEELRVGDAVLTPFGATTVGRTWESLTETLAEVRLSNGETLMGKPDHKVFVWGKGAVQLRDVRQGDTLEPATPWRRLAWKLLSMCSTKARNTGFKRLVDITSLESGCSARGFFTAAFGPGPTALYQKGTTFTTETTIGETTPSTISNSSTEKSTKATTLASGGSRGTPPSEEDWSAPGRVPPSGTLQMPEELGIPSTPNAPGRGGSLASQHASAAERSTARPSPAERSTAARRAGPPPSTKRGTPTSGDVRSAAKRFWQTVTGRPLVALESAAIESAPPTPVFNLTLREHNAYYANGALVFNCLTFAASDLRATHFAAYMPESFDDG